MSGRQRTVLVTGGAGMIGAMLVRLLEARGDHVRVIDDLSTGQAAYLEGSDVALRPDGWVRASLLEPAAVARAVDGVDAVVHLAARAGIVDSVRDPVGTFEANAGVTVRLLEASRRAGVRSFVFASSNAAAGQHEPPASETHLPHPTSPYGASKLAGEASVGAFAATYGIAAASLRFSNAYGPYSMHKQSAVASFVRAALAGRPLRIFGDGLQTRDFVHSRDLAGAVLAVLDAPPERAAGELFQAGTGVETSVLELVTALGSVLGHELPVEHAPPRVGDLRRNVSRVDKAAGQLGWHAATGLVEGLAETVDWFRAALADPRLAAVQPSAISGSE